MSIHFLPAAFGSSWSARLANRLRFRLRQTCRPILFSLCCPAARSPMQVFPPLLHHPIFRQLHCTASGCGLLARACCCAVGLGARRSNSHRGGAAALHRLQAAGRGLSTHPRGLAERAGVMSRAAASRRCAAGGHRGLQRALRQRSAQVVDCAPAGPALQCSGSFRYPRCMRERARARNAAGMPRATPSAARGDRCRCLVLGCARTAASLLVCRRLVRRSQQDRKEALLRRTPATERSRADFHSSLHELQAACCSEPLAADRSLTRIRWSTLKTICDDACEVFSDRCKTASGADTSIERPIPRVRLHARQKRRTQKRRYS